MLDWIKEYESWEGRAEDLARLAAVVLERLKVSPSDIAPNERLVRDYVHKNILDRPKKRGREALFGFRHLLQFVAARILAGLGVRLSLTGLRTRTLSNEELMDLIATPPGVETIFDQMKTLPAPISTRPSFSTARRAESEELERVHPISERSIRRGPPADARSLWDDIIPSGRPCVAVEVTPWCCLYVEERKLAMQSEESFRVMVSTLTSLLRGEFDRLHGVGK